MHVSHRHSHFLSHTLTLYLTVSLSLSLSHNAFSSLSLSLSVSLSRLVARCRKLEFVSSPYITVTRNYILQHTQSHYTCGLPRISVKKKQSVKSMFCRYYNLDATAATESVGAKSTERLATVLCAAK